MSTRLPSGSRIQLSATAPKVLASALVWVASSWSTTSRPSKRPPRPRPRPTPSAPSPRAGSATLKVTASTSTSTAGPGREIPMPELFEIIESTRAMRRLKPDPVPDELVQKILRAGVSAANGGNTQRWCFLVVTDQAIKKKVQVYYKRALDEVVGPRYRTSAPPPGVTREQYDRQHSAVERR